MTKIQNSQLPKVCQSALSLSKVVKFTAMAILSGKASNVQAMRRPNLADVPPELREMLVNQGEKQIQADVVRTLTKVPLVLPYVSPGAMIVHQQRTNKDSVGGVVKSSKLEPHVINDTIEKGDHKTHEALIKNLDISLSKKDIDKLIFHGNSEASQSLVESTRHLTDDQITHMIRLCDQDLNKQIKTAPHLKLNSNHQRLLEMSEIMSL